jgi:hypothetical protein
MISFIHGASVIFAQQSQPMLKLKAERKEEEKVFFFKRLRLSFFVFLSYYTVGKTEHLRIEHPTVSLCIMENLYKLSQFYLNVLFDRMIQTSERISIVFLPWPFALAIETKFISF